VVGASGGACGRHGVIVETGKVPCLHELRAASRLEQRRHCDGRVRPTHSLAHSLTHSLTHSITSRAVLSLPLVAMNQAAVDRKRKLQVGETECACLLFLCVSVSE
jgi:hypothetical protein